MNPVITIDHDQAFKSLLTTCLSEFLTLFFPEMLEYLEPDSLTLLDKEIFTDLTAGERLEADLVAQARMRGQKSFFLVHIESQAQHQEHFARRMFRYFAWLYQKYGLPVYPIALLSFASPRKAQPESLNIAFPDFQVCTFNYRVVQLNRLDWRAYVNNPNPVASALMAKMKIAKRDRPRVKAECLRLLATLRLNPAKMALIFDFVDTYLRLTAAEHQQFLETLNRIAPESEEIVMSLMTQSEERGMQQGMQQGMEQGVHLGTQSLLAYLLENRFGTLTDDLRAQLAGLSLVQLQELSVAQTNFTTLAEIVSWIESRQTVN